MTFIFLLVCLSGLPLVFAQCSGRTDRAVVWRASLGLGIFILSFGMLLTLDWSADAAPTFFAEAQGLDEQRTEVTLMADEPNGRRSAWRFVLKTPIKSGYELVLALGVLGLLGGVMTLRIRPSGHDGTGAGPVNPTPMITGVWVALASLAAFTLWTFLAQPSGQSGAEGVRAALAHFEVGGLSGFTIPEGSWGYASDRVLVLSIVTGLAVIGLVQPWLPLLKETVRDGAALVGAVGAAFVCSGQMFVVGGLPWRGVEGSLWLAALCLVFAVLNRRSALQSAALTTLALAVTCLAV